MILIYIFSVLLIISIGFLTFVIYADKLNKELEKKKEKRTFKLSRSKFFISKIIMIVLTVLVSLVLTVEIVDEIHYDFGITSIDSYKEYSKVVNCNINNKLDFVNKYNITKVNYDKEFVYSLDDGEIVKVDRNGEIVKSVACDSFNVNDTIYLYNDKLVILSNKNNMMSFEIYDKNTLQIIKSYEVKGNYIFSQKQDKYIDLFLWNDANINPYEMGLTSPIGETIGKTKKIYVVKETFINLVVSHYKYNLDTNAVEQIAVGLTDLYYTFDDYHYLAFNLYDKERMTNNSILMIYDASNFSVKKYNVLKGNLFKNPVMLNNNINVITKSNDNYYTYEYDEDFEKVKYIEANSEEILSFNNDIVSIHNKDGNLYLVDERVGMLSNASIMKDKLIVRENNNLNVIDLNDGNKQTINSDIALDSYEIIGYIKNNYLVYSNGLKEIIFNIQDNVSYTGDNIIYMNKKLYSRFENGYKIIGG